MFFPCFSAKTDKFFLFSAIIPKKEKARVPCLTHTPRSQQLN